MERNELISKSFALGLFAGDKPAPTEQVLEKLASFQIFPESQLDMLLGFVAVELERFKDSPAWDSPAGISLIEALAVYEGPNESLEGNNFFVGRFAAGDTVPALRELIRRAKHRNGDPATIGAGNDAINILTGAARVSPALVPMLEANGYGPDLKFGNHPPGSETAFKLPVKAGSPVPPRARPASGSKPTTPRPAGAIAAARRLAETIPIVVAQPAPEDVGPARGVSMPAPAPIATLVNSGDARGNAVFPEGNPAADLPNGVILFGGQRLRTAEAGELANALLMASRELLIPMEGYTWVDDMIDPSRLTSLLCMDSFMAGPLSRPDGNLPGLPESNLGGFLRGVVSVTDSNQFEWVMFLRDGGQRKCDAPFDYQDVAQVALAAQVRALIASAPSPAESL